MSARIPKFYLGTQIDGPNLKAEQLYVRATDLNDLIGRVSYTEALFHILQGRLPTAEERDLFDIVLVAFHGGFGLLPPTTLVPRLVAGTGVSTPQALAAGYLASGPYHVGAVEQAMGLYSKIFEAFRTAGDATQQTSGGLEQFAYDQIAGMIERKETIPGYGHPLLRKDPRPTHSRRLLCEKGVHSPFFDIFDGVVRCMLEKKGVPANVDGITAAILLKLGFRTEHGTGLFLLARTAGMLAHIVEEQTDMPYQTQKRFMVLPVAMPKLFNANFKRLAKLFNRLRDNGALRGLGKLLSFNSGKKFEQREAEGKQAIADFRKQHAARSLADELTDIPDLTSAARDEFVAAAQSLPETPEPPEPTREELDSELDDVCAPEILAGAACLIVASLERMNGGESETEKQQRAAELLNSALNMVQEASRLVDHDPAATE